jgi:hypothetical protein
MKKIANRARRDMQF